MQLNDHGMKLLLIYWSVRMFQERGDGVRMRTIILICCTYTYYIDPYRSPRRCTLQQTNRLNRDDINMTFIFVLERVYDSCGPLSAY